MELDMEDLTKDLDNVMFDLTEGRIYVAMKDLENIISDLKSLVKEYK
tara:strand:- start:1747 stop:1887 length:141 start_codon:yes stop_codon:yes gene_type:complete